jgi:transposase-like protein
MFLYENGFNIIDQRKYCKEKQEKCRNLLDRTLLKVGSQYVWVWVAIEPLAKVIVGSVFNLKEQCLLLLKDFLRI